MITHQKFQDGNLREAAISAGNAYAVSAESIKTLARAEMGRKPLVHDRSLSFEKHQVVLQFDMLQFHSPISPTEIGCKHALCHVEVRSANRQGEATSFRIRNQL